MSRLAMTAILTVQSTVGPPLATPSPPPAIPTAPISMSGVNADIERLWQKRRDQLVRHRAIEPDWDGNGAVPPNPAVVDSVIALLQSQAGRDFLQIPPTNILLFPDGAIGIEWALEDVHTVMRFDEPTRAEVITMRSGRPPTSFWRDFSAGF